MEVDAGGVDVFMAQELTDDFQVVAVFKQVGGKAVSEGMGRDPFG